MSRIIPKAQAWQFMRALAKRARRRAARGWDPVCEHVRPSITEEKPDGTMVGADFARCGERADRVDHNMRPLCREHAELEVYSEKFR